MLDQIALTPPAVYGTLYGAQSQAAVDPSSGGSITYIAYFGDDRDVYVAGWDNNTGEHIGPSFVGPNRRWEDPHSAPELAIMDDGTIIIAYGSHSDEIRIARGTVAGGFTWQDVGHGTYPLLAVDRDNDNVFLFYRAGYWHNDPFPSHEFAGMQRSNDGGQTWTTPKAVVDTRPSGSEDTDAYVRDATWYDGYIHFTMQLAYGTNQVHDEIRANIYHAKFDPVNEDWYTMDGTYAGPVLTRGELNNHVEVLNLDGAGTVTHYVGSEGIIIVGTFDPTSNGNGTIWIAKWDGSSQSWDVVDTGIVGHFPWAQSEIIPDGSGGWLGYFATPNQISLYTSFNGLTGWSFDQFVAHAYHNKGFNGENRLIRVCAIDGDSDFDVMIHDGGWNHYGNSWTATEIAKSQGPVVGVARPGNLNSRHIPWRAPVFAQQWWNVDEPYSAIGYRRDTHFIQLKGFVRGESGAPARVFRLPEGFRPDEQYVYEKLCLTSGARGRIDVMPDGWVRAMDGEFLSLDGIVFAHPTAGWATASLESGWTGFPSSGLTQPEYTRTAGRVYLKGFVEGPGSGFIFRLPSGYRPPERRVFRAYRSDDHGLAPSRIDVHPDGWVEQVSGDYQTCLDSIVFHNGGEAWVSPTLESGWSWFGSDLATPGYLYDDDDDLIHLKGFLNGPGPSRIFRLPGPMSNPPYDYRPDERRAYEVFRTGGDNLARVDVRQDGWVVHVDGGENLSLDGIMISPRF